MRLNQYEIDSKENFIEVAKKMRFSLGWIEHELEHVRTVRDLGYKGKITYKIINNFFKRKCSICLPINHEIKRSDLIKICLTPAHPSKSDIKLMKKLRNGWKGNFK